ncbi:peptidoglycan DD-metalloendopeptidase family protein [Aequorivita echinoideorum]|uniref:Peptidoglycan DD-metalloendopeptidase family protein n=1 Tax=Aequorivita echinoideorum TaxID=1549647 RepID=A0ABS5S0R8_9FLAO|nr:peptidoglycan DD-metalloendopeptidase family protein [Aequorivita echinoideorum]MBT0606796.1 peptidoglycan DD-metalloendopeptidase family protein [Aequorivita echinoideorum]
MPESSLFSSEEFKNFATNNALSLHDLFPKISFSKVLKIDMESTLPPDSNYDTVTELGNFIVKIQIKNPDALLANGYLEKRRFYTTDAYKKVVGKGVEYRNIHLGTDFWVVAQTPIHALYDGKIVILHDNNFPKDYGPTLVLEHTISSKKFYTLYGHLSRESLSFHKKGNIVKAGECIGFIGDAKENGGWAPHLHFQVILNLLGNSENFPGVAFPSEIETWKKICPNPSLLFSEDF